MLVVVLAACCLSQPAFDPAEAPALDPALHNPSIDDRLLEQQKPRVALGAVAPSPRALPQSPVPGVAPPRLEGEDAPALSRRYPDSTFIPPRAGVVVRAAGGEAVFVPEADAAGRSTACILLPCRTLERVLTLGDARMELGGQTFVYRGRQYMLPTILLEAGAEERAAPSEAAAPADDGHETAPTSAPLHDADPSVDAIIRDLEDHANVRPIPMERLEAAPEARQAPAEAVAAGNDGGLMVNRRARVLRLPEASGRYAAVFDNDNDSPAEAPMLMLPSRALERLETAAARRGENTAFVISGRTYVFEGRTYLLPVLAIPQRAGEIAPMQ